MLMLIHANASILKTIHNTDMRTNAQVILKYFNHNSWQFTIKHRRFFLCIEFLIEVLAFLIYVTQCFVGHQRTIYHLHGRFHDNESF